MMIMNDMKPLDTPIARRVATDVSRGTEATTIVVESVRRRLVDSPYAYYLNRVAWHFDEGILTLTGIVPTDCLKYSLEKLLRDLVLVERIINDVQVVSSTGLSSTWNRPTGRTS